MHLDDQFGGQKQAGVGLLEDMQYNSVMVRVAKWYNNFAVSPVDSLRKIVLAEPRGGSFSLPWTRRFPDPHFGFSTHIVVVWAIAYSFLEVLTAFCDDVRTTEIADGLGRNKGQTQSVNASVSDLIATVPPPSLMSNLQMKNVAVKWKERAMEYENQCQGKTNKCELAWVAGHDPRTGSLKSLERYLSRYISENKGWTLMQENSQGFAYCLGLVATGANSSMSFALGNIRSKVKRVTVLSMKSYGEKWAESRALFSVYVQTPGDSEYIAVRSFEVEGFHEMQTSVLYTTEIDLGNKIATVGSDLKVQVDLIGGSTFKIGGMMICNS